ncbi:MAG: hypothetical protein F6K19_36695, partial [Cyanothece sp. SIO1E1]|nr:hypothetical protein [Cyanothece sp. SIO1E1]
TTWSALTLIPDPQLSNGPLDVSTEQLWYYLYWKYGNNLYTKRGESFVGTNDNYLDAIRTFFQADGDGTIWYSEMQNGREYKTWSDFRKRKDFEQILGESMP